MKPLVLAELYAGVQISNKEVAVKSKLSNIMLKTRFPFIYASISRDTKTLTIASIRCLASQQIFRLSIFSAGFFFAFGNFARYCVVLLNAPPSDRDKKKKKVSVMVYFSREILIQRQRRQEVPSSHWRRDNLLAWRELFANLLY